MYPGVVAIHATAMSAALALLVLRELLLTLGRGGNLRAVRLTRPLEPLGGVLMGIGLLAGIALVILGGWSLLTPWLLVSFALIAALLVVEARLVRPWEARLNPAIAAAGTGPEIGAVLAERPALAGRLIMLALFALIVLIMRFKPELLPT